MVGLRLLACLAVLLAVAPGTADTTINSWSNCGGSQFCPCGTQNCDQQWPANTCEQSSACVRKDQTWWRCEPRQNVCGKTVDTWVQCGGGQKDAPYDKTCCKHGDACSRKDAGWWRCEPSGVNYDNNVCLDFAATWQPCSTAKKVCCSDPREACVFKTDQWSRCEPRDGQSSTAQPPRGVPPPPLAVDSNRLIRQDTKEPVKIRGINWFGFNVARTAVDGLGQGNSDVVGDFQTIVYQLKLLGYNAVRLPFRYRDLDQFGPKDFTHKCYEWSQEDLRRRLMEPGSWTDKKLPGNNAKPDRPSDVCNGYLPSVDTYMRLQYHIQVFIAHGMYVILDYQPMDTEPQAYNVKEFICKWRTTMSRVKAIPNFWDDIQDRIFVDILNEPDSMGIRWEPSNGKPGARELYIGTMDALHQLSPTGWLYMVEGTGQNSFGLNWGNGFITDSNIIRKYGLSDANPFFSTLWDKPYVGRVVMSPHVYPPSITRSTFLGDTLWQQCAIAFGYLENKGYCKWPGNCRRFPVIIGETGSFLHDWSDRQWMQDFSAFVEGKGGAKAYTSAPMAGWIWWCYNENGGDTGGLVYNGWSKFDWTKLQLMINQFGLWPWYKW